MAGNGKSATLRILGNNLDAKSKLDEIKKEADKLREDNPELTVRINRAQAAAEMAVLKDQLRVEAEEKPVRIPVKIDTEKLKTGLFGPTGLATLGAAGPAAVVLTGGLLGVASAGASAAAGLGLFGAVAKSVFTKAEGDLTSLTAAQAAYDKASTPKARAAALKNEQLAMSNLTGSQLEFAKSLTAAKNEWTNFVNAASPGVTKTLADGLGLIPIALKDIRPILAPTEKALDGIIGRLGNGLKSSGFKNFIDFLSSTAGPSITHVANIFGHLGSMIGKAIVDFGGVGSNVLGGLDKLFAKADAGTDSALFKLFNYFDQHGSQIVGDLKALGGAAVNIGKAFASTSGVNLAVLTGLSRFLSVIASNPVGAGALAVALGLGKIGLLGPGLKLAGAGIGTIVKNIGLMERIGGALKGLSILQWGAIGIAILAVAAITVLIVTHWKTIKKVAGEVWHAVLGFVKGAFNWIKGHWPLVLGILLGPVALATGEIIQHWHQIESGAKALLGKLEGFFKSLPGRILRALGDLGHLLWNAGKSIIHGLITGLENSVPGLKSTLGFITNIIPSWKGPADKDANLLRPAGRLIMGSLVTGLDDGLPGLHGQLARTTSAIASSKVAAAVGGYRDQHNITIEFVGGTNQDIISALKEEVRVRGGDPEIFGR